MEAGTLPCGPMFDGSPWDGMVWFHMVWYRLVWFDIVWHMKYEGWYGVLYSVWYHNEVIRFAGFVQHVLLR